MQMKDDGHRAAEAFHGALNRNAAAKALVRAMDAEQRRALERRARDVPPEEMDAFADAILGSQEGHPPYQL